MRATFCGKARHSWDKVARKIPGPRDNFWTENSKLECPNRGPDVQIAVSKSRPKLSKSRKVSVQRGGGITPPPLNSPGRPGLLRAACFLKKISLDKGDGLPLLTKVFLSTVLGAPDCPEGGGNTPPPGQWRPVIWTKVSEEVSTALCVSWNIFLEK